MQTGLVGAKFFSEKDLRNPVVSTLFHCLA
jgi:hypothetical protein